jgi:hypothetical protein
MLLKAWARAVFRTRGLRRRNNSAAKPVGSGPQGAEQEEGAILTACSRKVVFRFSDEIMPH